MLNATKTGWQLRELKAVVSRELGKEVEQRTFDRWRNKLGLTKGRGRFYDEEEAAVLVDFAQLVSANISYNDAHRIVYQKYTGN